MNLEAFCPAIQKCKQNLFWDLYNFKNRLANQKYDFWTAMGEMSGIGTLKRIGKDWAQIRCLNQTMESMQQSAWEMQTEYRSLPDHFKLKILSDLYANTQQLMGHSYRVFQEASDASKGVLVSKLVYLSGLGMMGVGASVGSTLATASGLGLSVLMGSAFLFRANFQDGDFWSQEQIKNLELQLERLNKQWDFIQSQKPQTPSAA